MSSLHEGFVEFSKETTCHGLRQITKPRQSWVMSITWAITVLAMACGMVWQLSYKILEYTEYDANTDFSTEFNSTMNFPDVTICNFNRLFNFTNKKELLAVDAILRSSSPGVNHEYDDWWRMKIQEFLNDRNAEEFYLSEEFELRGWELNDKIIQKCTFKQRPCSAANFTKVVSSMGNCFTFTPRFDPYQNSPGSKFGLVLTLDIKHHLYSEHPSFGNQEAGVKVLIHNSDEIPLVEEFGISVPSGQTAHIVVTEVQSTLMYRPWGVCSQSLPKMKYYTPYTFRGCIRECRLEQIVEKCNCAPYWAPQHHAKECESQQIMDCAGPMEGLLINDSVIQHECVQPCESIAYETKVSYATFPSLGIGEILSQQRYHNEVDQTLMHEKFRVTDEAKERYQRYRDNHLQLDIYYDSPSFQKITQTKKVTEISLFSDLGGLLGLWLGISVVTIGEFIQFVFKSMVQPKVKTKKEEVYQEDTMIKNEKFNERSLPTTTP